ncbi:DUF1707 domain-containing protein [Nocardiopsis sp. HNM0947]|uniref:DUF1707 domain-containing protein n=1 Tax=Nocardiopsis coralli TaxID=2772213 RepID=A0ABR9P8V0_9ACTN|nr:DUF1707 domain-containing protein [Nocardiopsis coralli]MBE3000256.1 DUF1707 domain-containing protein [Nocardiopsis coralli]
MSDLHYRISDSERDEALGHLRTALEEGRLSVDEHGERTHRALSARTNDDLRPVFDDLPQQLWPSAVAQPPVPTAAPSATPATPPARDADETGKADGSKDEDEGTCGSMNLASAFGGAGFLFFVWGLPAFFAGSVASVLVFLAVVGVMVVIPLTAHFRSQRERNRGTEAP